MRKLILLLTCVASMHSYAQTTTALCDVIGDIEKYKAENTLFKLATTEKNLDGSHITNIIPARFSESKLRILDEGFFLEFYTYGKRKQMEKVLKALIAEIEYCYPEHVIEEGDYESDNYRKLFFCHSSEKGGSLRQEDYEKMTFIISIAHSPEESKIVLAF